MMCGIKQGLLASKYSAHWHVIRDQLFAEDERRVVQRSELQDFSLHISPLFVNDSAKYTCNVNIEIGSLLSQAGNPWITLLVYRKLQHKQSPLIDAYTFSVLFIIQKIQKFSF